MIYVLICEPHGSEEIWDQVSLNLCESALLVDFMTGLNVMDHQFMRQFIYQFPIVTQVINNALNNVTCAKLFEMISYYKAAKLSRKTYRWVLQALYFLITKWTFSELTETNRKTAHINRFLSVNFKSSRWIMVINRWSIWLTRFDHRFLPNQKLIFY